MKGKLTTGKCWNPVSNMLHHMKKWFSGDRHKRFENDAAFWAGIPVEVTQEAGVVPRYRRAKIGTPF